MSTLADPASEALPAPDPSWRGHIRATLKLGLPLIAAQLGQQAITLTDTIMLGWLSPAALAAGVLATTLYFIAFIIASGFAHGVMPLVATAEGEGNVPFVRRSVRMGFWIVTFVVLLLLPPLWFTEPLLLALGQEPELAAMAQDYVRIAQWSLFPALWVMVLRSYLSALESTDIVMWAMFCGVALNALLNWTLIFGNWGAPALGIKGAAIATTGTQIITLIPMLLYAAWLPSLKKYKIFTRIFRPDWTALRDVFRIGAPVSGTLLAEVGLFAAASFMLGWLGTIPLAAHGIALKIISVIFMVFFGLSAAATVRAGRALGRRDAQGLDRAAKTVMAMAGVIAALAAIMMWTHPEWLIRLFLSRDEPAAAEIIRVGASLLAVAAIFQIVDAFQVISLSLLRGIHDTRRPMVIAVLSYWGLGVPSAYVMGFVLDWGGPGVWGGLAVGLTVASTLLTVRFLRREALGLVPT